MDSKQTAMVSNSVNENKNGQETEFNKSVTEKMHLGKQSTLT